MLRIKWYSAKWFESFERLSLKIKKQLFIKNSKNGFIIEKVRHNYIEGKYIEKYVVEKKIQDPLGDIIEFIETDFHIVSFCLHKDYPEIEFYNAPRNLDSFINKIQELSNFNLIIEPIEIDLYQWVTNYEINFLSKVLVDTIQISGFDRSKSINMKLLLQSNQNLKKMLIKFNSKKGYSIEKIHIKTSIDEKEISLQLSKNGSLKMQELHRNYVLSQLRKSINSKK